MGEFMEFPDETTEVRIIPPAKLWWSPDLEPSVPGPNGVPVPKSVAESLGKDLCPTCGKGLQEMKTLVRCPSGCGAWSQAQIAHYHYLLDPMAAAMRALDNLME